MLHRPIRINFRLTQEEHAKFAPLIREFHAVDWSGLCRLALRTLHKQWNPPASDNGVRHTGPQLSDSRSPVRQPKRRTGRKKTSPRKKRQKV